jgi:hypothetical protein
MREQRAVLRHPAQSPPARRQAVDADVSDDDFARHVAADASDRFEDRRFARATGAEQRRTRRVERRSRVEP